jgi:diacylglycerol kinase family enzyme
MDQLLVIYHEQAGGSTAETRASVVDRLRAEADVVVEGVVNEADLRRVLDRHRERRPVVLGGSPRALDVLVDDAGGVAVNAVHLGVGAEAAERAAPLKGGLGRLAYPIGALLAGIRGRGWRVRVSVDGRVVAGGRQRVLMVGLANGARIGGGTPLAPGARPDDGLVDVLVSFSTSLSARLIYGALLRRGRHPRLRDVVTMRGREISVRGEPVPVNVDGEIGAPITERRWSVTPAAVHVMVPAE